VKYLPPVAAALLSLALAAQAQTDRQDYSPAERLLFMSPHLETAKPPQTLEYGWRKSGELEPGQYERAKLVLTARAGGGCCAAHTEFLGAALPDLDEAQGNPLIMSFLERDVREMQRLTGGSQGHFRKMIRMAVYESARVRTLALPYKGRLVQAQEVVVQPFLNDPNRPRYERFARKEYRFMLSPAVPGGLYGIRSQVPGKDESAPALLVEELYLDGTEPNAASAPR